MSNQCNIFDDELAESPLFEVQSPTGRTNSNKVIDEEYAPFSPAGDANLYGVYESSKDRLFDSDEAIGNTGSIANVDIVIHNAEKLLQLAVGERKVLLEGEVDFLPPSFRLESGYGRYRDSATRTLSLVEDIISGEAFTASTEAALDSENIQSGVYIQKFTEECHGICATAGNLVDSLNH